MPTLIRRNNAPVNTTPPSLYGSGEVDRYLFLVRGEYAASPDFWTRRSYAWFKNGVEISGETRPTYRVRAGDVGASLKCRERITTWLGQYTFEDTATVTAVAATTISDLTAAEIGLKALQTTGSITVGTNTLTVADATGFEIGDAVIVETGGEAGLGLRGTMGVGGAWPRLSYANAAARTADTSKPDATWAWDLDTGDTYQWSTATSTWTNPRSWDYYYVKAQAKALTTTITGIAGNVLTLDDNASATATAANVYFDNTFVWNTAHDQKAPTYALDTSDMYLKRVVVPAGTYAFSERIYLTGSLNACIEGAGKTLTHLKSPNGTPPIALYTQGFDAGYDQNVIRKVHFLSNWSDNPYAVADPYATGTGEAIYGFASITQQSNFYNIVEDCKFTNHQVYAIAWRNCLYCYAYDCDVVHTTGHRFYFQWAYNYADGFGGGCWNCTVNAIYTIPGMEAFRHRFAQFVGCTLHNAGLSINSSGEFLVDGLRQTFSANSQKVESSVDNPFGYWHTNMESISINANIASDQVLLGGWVRNPSQTQAGLLNSNKNKIAGCIIAPSYHTADNEPNVLVTGGYPLNPEAGGLFVFPDYEEPGPLPVGGFGSSAVLSDGKCVVRGIRVIGGNHGSTNKYRVPIAAEGGSIITQCVVDYIYTPAVGTIELSGNMTNAEYEAL